MRSRTTMSRLGAAAVSLGIALVATLALARPAGADSLYGQGNYSDNCQYSTACPTPSPTPAPAVPSSGGGNSGGGSSTPNTNDPADEPTTPTTGELPSGLEFAINLTEGQTIPSGGYDVTVTPLNGEGATFEGVDFFVDEVLKASPSPSPTGTYYWRWEPKKQPGTRLKVNVRGPNGQVVTKNFRVRVAAASLTPGATADSAFTRAVKQIPVPVVYGFPYLLFILLGIAILMLIWQVRREVAESERLQSLLASERVLATEKTTFIQVASHYLRTPLTLINGGLDLADMDPSLKASLGTVRGRIQGLAKDVESLLSDIIHMAESATPAVAPQTNPLTRVWLRPGFLVPLVLIAILTVLFNLLVAGVGQFEVSIINLFIQFAVFLILALMFYFAFRNFVLRRSEARESKLLREERIAVDTSRNKLIHDAAVKLGQSMQSIQADVASVSAGPSTALTTLKNGLGRFGSMLETFATAERIQAGTLGAKPASFHVNALANAAFAASADAATAKHLKVQTPAEDAVLSCIDPTLFQRTISSLVGNAVAYSPEAGQVALGVEGGMQATRFSVTDQGPGLTPAQIAQLFQPFFRAEGALDFTHEGMGFSLYLDKLIMTYLGGSIRIEQNTPQGLRAIVELPV